MPHLNGIFIHPNAIIGEHCTIFQQVTIGCLENSSKAPCIGNNVYIGTGSKILGDVHIGDNCKVGANAVVTKSVPSGVTVIGFNKCLKQ